MREQLRAFLAFLKFNRNVSPHTLRAYQTDLLQLIDSLAARHACKASEVTLSAFEPDGIRGFLGELHDRGNSRG